MGVVTLYTRTELERAARLALRYIDVPEGDPAELAIARAVDAVVQQHTALYYRHDQLEELLAKAVHLARAMPDKSAAQVVTEVQFTR